MSKNLFLHHLFSASMVVYAAGKVLDYRNSLGRGEQNPYFQDAQGMFDAAKYRRWALIIGGIVFGGSLAFEGILSQYTPNYAFSLLIGSGTGLALGIYAIVLSRR